MRFVSHLLGHHFEMVHVSIDHNRFAISHQQTLVVEIILKGRMLNRSNMVWADVEKSAHIKAQTLNSVNKISLTRHLHDEMGHAVVYRCRHHFEEVKALRSCQMRFEKSLSIKRGVHG